MCYAFSIDLRLCKPGELAICSSASLCAFHCMWLLLRLWKWHSASHQTLLATCSLLLCIIFLWFDSNVNMETWQWLDKYSVFINTHSQQDPPWSKAPILGNLHPTAELSFPMPLFMEEVLAQIKCLCTTGLEKHQPGCLRVHWVGKGGTCLFPSQRFW